MATARHSLTRSRQASGRVPAALTLAALAGLFAVTGLSRAASAASYQIVVSNERSNDVTVISGADYSVLATIPVGKRPRGIHASPDGKLVYVAVSGTPVAAPPQLDAHGNPIFKRGGDDDDNDAESDKSADGIGIVDLAARKLKGKIFAGSDPEEFALSKDGTQLYVSNEDTKSASVVDIAKAKVEHIIPGRSGTRGSRGDARRQAILRNLRERRRRVRHRDHGLHGRSATSRSSRGRARWRSCRARGSRSSPRNPSDSST